MKSIKEWQKEIYENAAKHGFWDKDEYEGEFFDEQLCKMIPYKVKRPKEVSTIPAKLCLIHSEVSEALEGYRKNININEKGGMGEELADIVIRTLDLAEHLGIDIEKQIDKKHRENIDRPYKHGNKKF